MIIDDMKIGDPIKVLLTGSFHATISDLNETQFQMKHTSNSFPYLENNWFDKNLISVGKDIDVSDWYNNVDPDTMPDIYVVHLGALTIRKENE